MSVSLPSAYNFLFLTKVSVDGYEVDIYLYFHLTPTAYILFLFVQNFVVVKTVIVKRIDCFLDVKH